MTSVNSRVSDARSGSRGMLKKPSGLHHFSPHNPILESEVHVRGHRYLKCGEGHLANGCRPKHVSEMNQSQQRRSSDACTSSTLSTFSSHWQSDVSSTIASQPASHSSSIASSIRTSAATSRDASPPVSLPSSPAPSQVASKSPCDRGAVSMAKALTTILGKSDHLPKNPQSAGASCQIENFAEESQGESFFEELDAKIQNTRIKDGAAHADGLTHILLPSTSPSSPVSPVDRRSPRGDAEVTSPEASPVASLHSYIFDYDGICQELYHWDADVNWGDQRRNSRSRSLCMSTASDPLLQIPESSLEDRPPARDGVGVLLRDADGQTSPQNSFYCRSEEWMVSCKASSSHVLQSPHRLASSSSLREFAACSAWVSLRTWINLD